MSIFDLRENVARIRAVVEEDDNGEGPEEQPDWYVEQMKRHEQFKALLEKRLERDRELAEAAARRGEKPEA